MSKRVRTESKCPLKLTELRFGAELFEVLPFSSDVVFLVAQYSQPCLPADLRDELMSATCVLRLTVGHQTSVHCGGIDYDKERKTWYYTGMIVGTRCPFDDWPLWARQHRENCIEALDGHYSCPMWLWQQYMNEKAAIWLV